MSTKISLSNFWILSQCMVWLKDALFYGYQISSFQFVSILTLKQFCDSPTKYKTHWEWVNFVKMILLALKQRNDDSKAFLNVWGPVLQLDCFLNLIKTLTTSYKAGPFFQIWGNETWLQFYHRSNFSQMKSLFWNLIDQSEAINLSKQAGTLLPFKVGITFSKGHLITSNNKIFIRFKMV